MDQNCDVQKLTNIKFKKINFEKIYDNLILNFC